AKLEVHAGMRSDAVYFAPHKRATLATGHDVSVGAAGLCVEDRTGHSSLVLDIRARPRRCDLLVAREEGTQRDRRPAPRGKRRQHEGVHRKPGLHVGNAGSMRTAAADAERSPAGLSFWKYRIAVPEQQNGGTRSGVLHACPDYVALLFKRDGLVIHAHLVEKAAQHVSNRIDTRLVVASAVGVHKPLDQVEDR